MLDIATLRATTPPHLKHSVTQDLVDRINNVVSDPEQARVIGENFLHYLGVMNEGKFRLDDYLSAVTYVSLKLMGASNQDAYIRTFPDRYQNMLANGRTPKEISSMVSAYNSGKLVNLVREQSLVPTWVLNAHIYQKAINTQAELMVSSSSDLVRTQAANSILTHLAKPKAAGPLVAVQINEDSGMNSLHATLRELAQKQQELIRHGAAARDLAAAPLTRDEEVTDV